MKSRILAVALIAVLAACSGTKTGILSVRAVNAPVPAAAEEALARGDLLFSQGEYALALDAYRKAVRQEAGDAHGLNGVAISYAAMGRHDLARPYFELALARAPQDQRIQRNFARSLEAQGLGAEANALQAAEGRPKPARPTLAQLADRGPMRTGAATPAPGPDLERVSMGEVRLRTMPRLDARIVTVAAGRPVERVPRLTTAIRSVAVPSPVADARAAVKPCGNAVRARSVQVRLPATGMSIELAGTRNGRDGCSALADSNGRTGARG